MSNRQSTSDLDRIKEAVRFRDQCREIAMVRHEQCGLAPSFEYANATYDAIVDVIRENERRQWLMNE